jgi:hypothetical protein
VVLLVGASDKPGVCTKYVECLEPVIVMSYDLQITCFILSFVRANLVVLRFSLHLSHAIGAGAQGIEMGGSRDRDGKLSEHGGVPRSSGSP